MKKITKIATVMAVAALAVATTAGAAQTASKVKNGVTLTGNLVLVSGGAQPTAYATSSTSAPVGNLVASLHTYYGDGGIDYGGHSDSVNNGTFVASSSNTLANTSGHFAGYHQFTDSAAGFAVVSTSLSF
ncbi:hypothetical protein [Tumebacillus flagellatus]|uniref:Uncharacterized protein n=1 Tax=Tumebacillus flagellatus TaxID=1157490 RepID=A0A074LT03_9BACL|nr:hypothetical protein [Tumebacillus flagellatus]KEO82993.1 hypothetical protein EL26_12920 [Tumebacillus flagellatus]